MPSVRQWPGSGSRGRRCRFREVAYTESVPFRWLALALIGLLHGPGAAAQAPRLCGDVLLSLDTLAQRLVLTPLTGGARRSLSFAKAPEPFEALMVRDYVLRRDGRLIVSAAGVLPGQGGTSNLLLNFNAGDLSQPASLRNTGPVVCTHVAEARSGVWCLGPDFPALMRGGDYGVLHYFDDALDAPAVFLKRGELPRDAGRSPWAAGAQLLAAPNGAVVAWMPGVRRVARVEEGRVRVDEMPWEPRPQALVTAALDGEGRLHALLPLTAEESFSTKYGIFRLAGREWRQLDSGDGVPRGARLLGFEGQNALLIDRRERLVRIRLAELDGR